MCLLTMLRHPIALVTSMIQLLAWHSFLDTYIIAKFFVYIKVTTPKTNPYTFLT